MRLPLHTELITIRLRPDYNMSDHSFPHSLVTYNYVLYINFFSTKFTPETRFFFKFPQKILFKNKSPVSRNRFVSKAFDSIKVVNIYIFLLVYLELRFCVFQKVVVKGICLVKSPGSLFLSHRRAVC